MADAIIFFFLSFSFFTFLAPAHAEIIQLKNGNAIETKILKEDEEFLVVQAPGGTVKIPKSDIQTVWRGPKEQLVEVRGKEVYFAKGVEFYKEGKFKEAAVSFEQSRGMAGLDAILYANLGSAYAAAGEDLKAEESFQKAIQTDPKNHDNLLNVAHFYESRKAFSKAAEMYERFLSGNPKDLEAAGSLARCYYAMGSFQKASDIYKGLGPIHDIPTLNNQAATYIQLGEFEEAKKILHRIIQADPRFPQPLLNLAEISVHTKKYEAAEFQYKAVLAKDPKNMGALVGLAETALAEQDLANAEALFGDALKVYPENSDLKVRLAELFVRQGAFDCEAFSREKSSLQFYV
jgi:tetratricopeptide (TPR) repeat protein